MIKVVFLIRSLNQGGAERQLTTLVPRLNKDKFDVTVITFYSDGVFAEELAESNAKLLSLNKRSRWDLSAIWRLLKELKELQPAILHSYLVEPNLVAGCLKPFLKSTKVIWGIRASDRDISKYDWFVRMNFRMQALFSRFADLIIFNSFAGREHYLKLGFPSHTSFVIHSGIDIEKFKPERERAMEMRNEWTQAAKTVLIGLVGRLDPIKDHPTFLRAAALLVREKPDCKFICVGSGQREYAENLRRLGDELGLSDRLIWAGPRTDMPAVYNALNIACCSSVSEGLPNAIAEAMACGIPCVVTDVGDSELLVRDTGIVVPPSNPQALADGLSKCIDMLRNGQTANPRLRIIENFDSATMTNRTDAALTALMQC